MNPLSDERARASFPSSELTRIMRGGADAVARREDVVSRLAADPLLGRGRLDDSFLSREEAYKLNMARVERVHELGLAHAPGYEQLLLHREGRALCPGAFFARPMLFWLKC